MPQTAFSIATRIKPDQAAALEAILADIGNDIAGNTLVPFSQITTLHFACWVVLSRDSKFAPSLVLESNHDGPTDAHLDEWVCAAGPGLDAIYSKCEGYPADGAHNPNSLRRYLQQHLVPCPAFYVGCYGQSVPSVRHAMALRAGIETFLDREQAAGTLIRLSQPQIYERIQEFAKTLSLSPAYTPKETYDSILRRSKVNTVLWTLLAAALLLKFPRPIIVALLLFILVLRWHEMRDAKGPGPTPPGIDPRLFGKEDIWTQNHLTTLVNVKPGRFRLGTLKGVLWLINQLAKTVFIAGSLGGIPTIHFARWLLIDDDRRLLFFSNYDGSWASYLGDFAGHPGRYDDYLSRPLKLQAADPTRVDDATIRRILGGTIVGTVDTNLKAVVQAIDQLLDRPEALEAARAAAQADDITEVAPYVWEALRFNPQNPFLIRHCERDYAIAEGTPRARTIPKGSLVLAGTMSAMFDPDAVPDPDAFRTDRPAGAYIHFGDGPHQCFGRHIGGRLIPRVAQALLRLPGLRRAEGAEGHLRYDGAFPDGLRVKFEAKP